MKTEMEVLDGVLVIETLEKDAKVVIEVTTGEVLHLEHLAISIQKLTRFINAAKARYSKFLISKAAKDFIE